MKKQILLFNAIIIAFALMLGTTSCKKDENPTFVLSSLNAGSINLNGATPPTDVPQNPTITAVFSVDVNASTANNTTITLIRDYDAANIPLTVTTSGSTVTIVPNEDLGNGSLYSLTFTSGIMATDGQGLSPQQRAFTTVGTFVPSGVFAYWNFNGNANDVTGTYNPSSDGIVDIAYQPSFTTAADQAAYFNGTTSIIEIPNAEPLLNTGDFTLSFWVKSDSANHPQGYFVMGMGAFYGFQFEMEGSFGSCKLAARYNLSDTATASEDLWFNGSGQYNGNGGWQGWTFCKDLTTTGGVKSLIGDQWANIVCIYQASTKLGTMYINGQKMKQQDFNLWPDGDPKRGVVGLKWGGTPPEVYPTLAFGFIQSRQGTLWATEPWGGYTFPTANHFKGWLDEVRIFHKAITEQEIQLMYNSAKP